MAQDILLDVEGIKGESKDAEHPDTIELESFAWEAENPDILDSTRPTLRTSGKVNFTGLKIITFVSKATPELMLKCWTGTAIKRAKLYVRKQGEEQKDFYIVTMDNVIIKKGSSRCSHELLPIDEFILTFSKITFQYRAQRPDGELAPPITVGYDLLENKRI